MPTNTSKVFIDIITQFTGTKSIKKAETSFDRLAKSIGRVVSVAAIEEFSRATIKAFLADDAAANQLVKTLNNLGIAFNPTSLDAYIQNLQNITGVLDDQLRPAFAQLAVATRDYTTSQTLLTTALDVSQGTGKSLSAVTTALSKAYLGNFAAISRLGAGVSKAQIKAGNFNDIVNTLNQNFSGSALAAADTYAGKVKLVGAAFTDVKEIIGKGLVDAFSTLSGDNGSVTSFTKSMRDAAQYVADMILGIGIVASKLDSVFSNIPGFGLLKQVLGSNPLVNLGKKQRESKLSNNTYTQQKALLVAQNRSVLATKELVKTGNAQTKAAKDKLLAEKASLILKTAAKVLDTEQAGIMAALMRNLSEDDQNRLKLQQALLNDNANAAGKLAQTILASQQAALLAQKSDPFSGWNASLQTVLDSLRMLATELAVLGVKAVIPIIPSMVTPTSVAATSAASKYVDDIFNRNKTTGAYTNTQGSQTINLVVDREVLTTVVTNGQNSTTASGTVLSTKRIDPIPYTSGF